MKATRWIFGSDNHGDHRDPKTIAAFLEFTRFWKPQLKIHGGDCWDLRWLRAKATDEERRERITPDLEAGADFADQYRPTHFITGNHDYRIWRALSGGDGKLSALAQMVVKDITKALRGAVLIPYGKRKGVFELDGFAFLHGYSSGMYAARDCATIYGASLMGHVHTSTMFTVPRRQGAVTAHTSACLCALDMDYNESQAQTLRQMNGWCYGIAHGNGRHTVYHATASDGKFILPSEMREFGAGSQQAN